MDKLFFDGGWFEAIPHGQCIDFLFHNQIGSTFEKLWNYNGNKVLLLAEVGDKKDHFSVIPALGWELVTKGYIEVSEWTTGVITVCQQLMS